MRSALSTRRARSVPPWTMPNWLRSVRSCATNALPRPLGPQRRAVDRGTDDPVRRRQRRAHVQHHLDVAAQRHLDVDRALGAEVVAAAVVGRREGRAVVVDPGRQREDLVAARVGQHVPAPVREAVQPPERGHQVRSRAQHEVVGVAEDDLGAQVLQVGRRQRAHRSPGADRHEARRREAAPRRGDGAGAGVPAGGVDGEGERHGVPSVASVGGWPDGSAGGPSVGSAGPGAERSSHMASPKDRNR